MKATASTSRPTPARPGGTSASKQTKQIPSILVDPHDPNLVMVAAQGNIHEKSDKRGVFRSTDGGATWTKTLYVDDETGIQKLAWAQDVPDVILATTVRHYSAPGAGRGGGGGGGRADGSDRHRALQVHRQGAHLA